ncbi:MAG: arylsulfotransferase family protein [Bacteroidales bacterium]|nr:arylsulfotransferase family protein [Bacteroidales bacterium]
MNRSLQNVSKLAMIVLFSLSLIKLSSQPYQYLSPIPGSDKNTTRQSIAFRTGKLIDAGSLKDDLIHINGSLSGRVFGKIKLAADQKTVIFQGFQDFWPGERIRVTIHQGFKHQDGTNVPGFDFDFVISKSDPIRNFQDHMDWDFKQEGAYVAESQATDIDTQNFKSLFSLPVDFPPFEVTVDNNPADGNYFLFSLTQNPAYTFYMMILDRHGVPVFYRRHSNRGNDLKLQANGYLTYFDFLTTKWTELDSSYQFRRLYEPGNGYIADAHELIVNENGDYWLLIYDSQPVDMSQIVEGGNPNATVVGLVVQHCDAQGNVLFQWRSWDQMEITDCDTSWVDLTAAHIDYVHGNAITFDDFGNVVISSRKMHEITKIDPQTGNIIWRWGGKQNMFELVGDDRWFSAQHSITYQGSNIYTMFDNGFRLEPEYSRGLMFELDEQNMTATLLQTYENDPYVYAWAMGHMQVLPNDNVVLGWATNPTNHVLTEYHPDGSKAFEIICIDSSLISYRVFKFDWKHNVFDILKDTIEFGEVDIQTGQLTSTFVLRNQHSQPVIINDVVMNEPAFSIISSIPFTIPAFSEVEVEIAFNPLNEGLYEDVVYLGNRTATEYIGNSIVVRGNGIFTHLAEQIADEKLLVYPNPACRNDPINVKLSSGERIQSLVITDIWGRQLLSISPNQSGSIQIPVDNLKSGYYLIHVNSNGLRMSHYLIIQQ